MQSGQLDTRISILSRNGADELGQPTGLTLVANLWARRQPNRGREVIAAGTIGSEANETFTIRYRTDIAAGQLVTYNGKQYEITYIAEPERRVSLDLVCRVYN